MLRLLSNRKIFWMLLALACITIIPFLGLADFHTKGEPREAVVTYSMLAQDDWILPRNNGGEIPYKPPFFHWCIAAASQVTGGEVTEFSSRIPSALALIAMTMSVFVFYSRRKDTMTALLTAMVTLTAFELHRAGANCRVDMVLTALSVMALLLFYRYWQRGLRGVPWLAILLMSCATLTKGPVGSVIPCLAFGVFLLARGVNFFKAFGLLTAWGLASFILPLCWYWAAYLHGGQEFLDLVMEENFGRMTNTMSYNSCVNPWPYNFLTLAGGYLPWILLALFSLFSMKKIRGGLRASGEPASCTATGPCSSAEAASDTNGAACSSKPACIFARCASWLRNTDPVNLFSAICIAVIFLFYCFPQSKRSVYLMPIYPFIAYFLARYMLYLAAVKSKAIKAYGWFLAAVGILVSLLFLAIKAGAVPETIFHGRHAAQNIAMLDGIASISGFGFCLALLPLLLAAAWGWYIRRHRQPSSGTLLAICALTFGLYIAVDGALQPAVLNAKSKRVAAEEIALIAPPEAGTIYEFIEEGERALGDPVHFFELNFYLGDRLQNFRKSNPSTGYLLITQGDADAYIPQFEQEGYRFTPLYTSSVNVLHHSPVMLFSFVRTETAEGAQKPL